MNANIKNISVIIPTYNRARTICRSIESVLAQEGQGENYNITEIIIVDDCSTDNTEEVIKDINDSHIRYVRNDKNLGAGGARNRGAEIAKAEWIAFHDSDDIWMADKLKKQIQYLDENPGVTMVGGCIRTKLSGNRMVVTGRESSDDISTLAIKNFIDAPTILIKRDTFLELGGFDENLKALEDWDLALRYAADNRIGFVNEVVLEAEMLDEGVSAHAGNYFDARCRMIAKNKDLLLRHNLLQPAMEQLLGFAKESGVLEEAGKLLEYYLTVYA